MKPEALAELEAKTGLDPARDLDQIVVAGTGVRGTAGVAVALGHFDLYKLGRAIEASGKAHGTSYEGVTVYNFSEESKPQLSLALVDESTLVLGPTDQVTQALASRTRGETPLKTNTALMARVEKIQPGSTFWMVGDQSLLASLPTSIPAPGASAGGGSIALPSLVGLTVTGDLEPQVSIAVTGEARDAAAAKNLADVVRGLVAMASLQAAQKPELQQLASAVSVATEENRVLVSRGSPTRRSTRSSPSGRRPCSRRPSPHRPSADRGDPRSLPGGRRRLSRKAAARSVRLV